MSYTRLVHALRVKAIAPPTQEEIKKVLGEEVASAEVTPGFKITTLHLVEGVVKAVTEDGHATVFAGMAPRKDLVDHIGFTGPLAQLVGAIKGVPTNHEVFRVSHNSGEPNRRPGHYTVGLSDATAARLLNSALAKKKTPLT